MNSDNNDTSIVLSRRLLLQKCALTAGAAIIAATATPASAEQDTAIIPKKSSQTQAGYQHVTDSRKCGNCRHLQGADSCRVVEGKIELEGHCHLHAKKIVDV